MIRPEHRYYAESEDGPEWWFGLSIATKSVPLNDQSRVLSENVQHNMGQLAHGR